MLIAYLIVILFAYKIIFIDDLEFNFISHLEPYQDNIDLKEKY